LSPAFAGFQAAGRLSLPLLGSGYFRMITGDFNGDGRPDLLYTVFSSGGQSNQKSIVLFNDGKGGYTEGKSFVLDATGCVAVDLNGDGKDSLACYIGTSVSIYGNNGDGTFAAPVSYITTETAQSDISDLIADDFNNDGKQDVLVLGQTPVLNSSGRVVAGSSSVGTAEVFLSDGSGGLKSSKVSNFSLPSNRILPSLTYSFDQNLAGDATGDGKLDLILGYEGFAGENVQDNWFLTLVGVGDGTFSSGVVSTATANSAEGAYIRGLALLNFSGSSYPALAYLNDDGVEVAPGAGDGTFALPNQFIPLTSGQGYMSGAKLSNSGYQDIVLVSGAYVSVLRNLGSNLAAPVSYPVTNMYTYFPVDWNGDGYTDILVMAADSGSALGNEETNPFVTVLTSKGNSTFRDATGLFPPQTFNMGIGSMMPVDVNGDGLTDFVFSQTNNGSDSSNATFGAYLNDGKGGYTLVSNILPVPAGSNGQYAYIDVVGAADFNNDGKQDLLIEILNSHDVSEDTVGIALNNGDGTFAFPSSSVQGTSNGRDVIFDLNADGKPDVLLQGPGGLNVYLGNGTGSFSAPTTTIPLGTSMGDPLHFAVGDMNGDGKLDLLLDGSWLAGNEDGTFGSSKSTGASDGEFVMGDWNHDGRLDFALGQVSDTSVDILIYSNDGKGNFTQTSTISDIGLLTFEGGDCQTRQVDTYVRLYADDLNGDGYPDLVVGAGDGKPDIAVILSNGDGTFAPLQRYFGGSDPERLFFVNIGGAAHSIASYDHQFGASISLLLNQSSLNPVLSASAASVTAGGAVTLTAAITPVVAGSPAPGGTVNFLEGSVLLGSVQLVNGAATYPLSALTAGNHNYTAQYSGDASYSPATLSAATVTVTVPIAKATPTLTVTPSAAAITNQQDVTISVSVTGTSGQSTPSGDVTLASGSYNAQESLTSGSASFVIPAGTLSSGANTLTITYTGDGSYSDATKTTTVTVAPVSIVALSPAPIAPGESATATTTVLAGSNYSGTLNLTCTLAGAPVGAQSVPTCKLNPTSVTITAGGSSTTELTVKTTSASSSALARPSGYIWGLGSGGAVLAAMLMFGIPVRRRHWFSMLLLLVGMATAGAIGCGGGGNAPGSPVTPSTPATTAGSYTFRVTGTDAATASITTATTVSVTVR
jgi:hypothetical protein